MKKVYNAPYLKVVEVKNDVIATSLGKYDDISTQPQAAPYRNIFSEELLDGEDFEEEY